LNRCPILDSSQKERTALEYFSPERRSGIGFLRSAPAS